MPRFHNQRSLTENYGQTVPFCAVLNISESKQHTFERADREPYKLR